MTFNKPEKELCLNTLLGVLGLPRLVCPTTGLLLSLVTLPCCGEVKPSGSRQESLSSSEEQSASPEVREDTLILSQFASCGQGRRKTLIVEEDRLGILDGWKGCTTNLCQRSLRGQTRVEAAGLLGHTLPGWYDAALEDVQSWSEQRVHGERRGGGSRWWGWHQGGRPLPVSVTDAQRQRRWRPQPILALDRQREVCVGAEQGGGSRGGVRRRSRAEQRARGVLQVHTGCTAAQRAAGIIHVHLDLFGEVPAGCGRTAVLLITLLHRVCRQQRQGIKPGLYTCSPHSPSAAADTSLHLRLLLISLRVLFFYPVQSVGRELMLPCRAEVRDGEPQTSLSARQVQRFWPLGLWKDTAKNVVTGWTGNKPVTCDKKTHVALDESPIL